MSEKISDIKLVFEQAKMDEYPESAFFNVGTIDEVIENAKKLQAEA